MPKIGRRHTVSLLYAALIYLLSILMLLTLLYWFLSSSGFSEANFLIGAGGIAVIAMILGYILSGDILAPKQEMDAKFVHLSKEILHELNLPLATIEANSKMLKKAHSDEKSQRRLSRIDAASVRLKRLYDELVYTINKEIYNVEKEHFSLAVLIGERVEVLKGLGRNPFLLEISDHTLFADRIGFEQMIDNLLSNAGKYNKKNGTVSITLEGKYLSIRDTGKGIRNPSKVFKRYYKEQERGIGIGLHIVKKLCDELHITPKIISKRGEGTTFLLHLNTLIIEA